MRTRNQEPGSNKFQGSENAEVQFVKLDGKAFNLAAIDATASLLPEQNMALVTAYLRQAVKILRSSAGGGELRGVAIW